MNPLAARIPCTLIADDQPDVLAALRLLLKGAGYQTEAVTSLSAVLEAIKQRKFDNNNFDDDAALMVVAVQ